MRSLYVARRIINATTRRYGLRDFVVIMALFYVIMVLAKTTPTAHTPSATRDSPVNRGSHNRTHSATQHRREFNGTDYITQPDCAGVSGDTLLVFVHSDPHHATERAAIRSTWGNTTYYTQGTSSIKVIFSVGIPRHVTETDESPDMVTLSEIKTESAENRDILMLNAFDEYDWLTFKSLLTMLWIRERCVKVRYIFKTDDDVVLNTFAWLGVIKQLDEMSLSCCIVCCAWITPIVFREGKNEVTKTQYDADHYPSFCSGSGYLLSRNAMDAILEISSHVALLKNDDPYFTGVLTKSTEVSLITVQQDSYLITDKELLLLPSRGVMLLHHPNPIQWLHGWSTFITRSQEPVLRRTLTFHTVESSDRVSLPVQFVPSNNITLTKQCHRPQNVMFQLTV